MKNLSYKNNKLFLEDVELSKIVKKYGSPIFVYSLSNILETFNRYRSSFGTKDHLICYAVKANSNLTIINLLAKLGSGFDIVSMGELKKVIAAGGSPQKTVFSGVGKSYAEIEFALKKEIFCFNVESFQELKRIEKIARHMNKVAPISLRVNPDVNPKTHPYISTGLKENKFGITFTEALNLKKEIKKNPFLNTIGLDCHIGSQITGLDPFKESVEKIIELINDFEDDSIEINHIDFGGGLGIKYEKEDTPPTIEEWVGIIKKNVKKKYKIIIEPGRSLVGDSGAMITKVEYCKHTEEKKFLIVDAAMNDLIRPSLYDSYHDIVPLNKKSTSGSHFDIVGPICETGDFLAKNRFLNAEQGDYLGILSVGAYGHSMSSNYNSRLKCPEVLIDGKSFHLIRKREDESDLLRNEIIVNIDV